MPEQASVVSSDTVQPAACTTITRACEWMFELVLLVEYGQRFGADCPGCARESWLGGNDAQCVTVAASTRSVVFTISMLWGQQHLLAATNEELLVVDDRFMPDLFADKFWQLNETFPLMAQGCFDIS